MTASRTIVGIDAGSGVMLKTEQAIKDYDLTGYNSRPVPAPA
jgi:glycine betaine/proline transport system substrate-binding protein